MAVLSINTTDRNKRAMTDNVSEIDHLLIVLNAAFKEHYFRQKSCYACICLVALLTVTLQALILTGIAVSVSSWRRATGGNSGPG
jgi:hypothetical protein